MCSEKVRDADTIYVSMLLFAHARRIQRWAEVLGHKLYEACAKATAITDIRAVGAFQCSVPTFGHYHACASP